MSILCTLVVAWGLTWNGVCSVPMAFPPQPLLLAPLLAAPSILSRGN